MANCRGCGKPIVWIKTPGGKSMPCDPDPVPYWAGKEFHSRIVTPNGEVIACKLNGYKTATGIGYIPHWATCPKYKDFKKG
jgi:hypothetical protein